MFDKHEFEDTLPGIYEEVIGKPFYDPEWIGSETFKKEEWNILRDVCMKMYPDEKLTFEMMYSLIDIENRANSLNHRKGILDQLEDCIERTFYADENDATRYYQNRLERKKQLGGKYDEKFFAHIQNEGEEFDEASGENEPSDGEQK